MNTNNNSYQLVTQDRAISPPGCRGLNLADFAGGNRHPVLDDVVTGLQHCMSSLKYGASLANQLRSCPMPFVHRTRHRTEPVVEAMSGIGQRAEGFLIGTIAATLVCATYTWLQSRRRKKFSTEDRSLFYGPSEELTKILPDARFLPKDLYSQVSHFSIHKVLMLIQPIGSQESQACLAPGRLYGSCPLCASTYAYNGHQTERSCWSSVVPSQVRQFWRLKAAAALETACSWPVCLVCAVKGYWWVPGGRILRGETFYAAALRKAKVRETLVLSDTLSHIRYCSVRWLMVSGCLRVRRRSAAWTRLQRRCWACGIPFSQLRPGEGARTPSTWAFTWSRTRKVGMTLPWWHGK